MTIDFFTREDFEAALPTYKNESAEPRPNLWSHIGLVKNEHTYMVHINVDIKIMVRSSIDYTGVNASTGEDSIRLWLCDPEGKPMGSKLSKYITRVPGWQDRMIKQLRILWGFAKRAGYCPKCKTPKGVYIVKKKGQNQGRVFCKCRNCGNGFEFLTAPGEKF